MHITFTIKAYYGDVILTDTIKADRKADERHLLVDWLTDNHVVLNDGDTISISVDYIEE